MVNLNDTLARLRTANDPAERSRLALASIPPFGQPALAKLGELIKKTYDTDEADLRLALAVAACRIHADAELVPDAFWTKEIQNLLLYWHDTDRFGPLLPAFEQAFFALPSEAQLKLCQCIEIAWSKGLGIAFLPRLPAAWPILLNRIALLKLERYSSVGETLGSALVALGKDAVPLVLERLADASADGAEIFARSLAIMRTEQANSGLVQLLGHSSKAVRSAALSMLRALGPEAASAIEIGKQSKKKAIRDACTELFASLAQADESPLDARLSALGRDPERAKAVKTALDTILDAERYTQGIFAKQARELLPTLGMDLAASAWEYLISAPDHYRARNGVEAIIGNRDAIDSKALTALSVDGFTRCRPTSPYYAKELGKLLAPLGNDLIEPLSLALRKGDFPLRAIALDLLLPFAKEIGESIWIIALSDPGKTIRQTAKEALVACGSKAEKATATLLSAKKADIRLSAAETLEAIATSAIQSEIEEACSKEADGKVKIVLDRIASRIGAEKKETTSNVNPAPNASVDAIALLTKTKAAKIPKFISNVKLPDVRLKDGSTLLPAPALLGLLSHLMNEGPEMEDPLLRKVRPALHDEDASALSAAIYTAWLSAGSESKHKWCVYQRAILLDRNTLCDIGHSLDILTSTGHHHLAGWHLDTLARFGRVPGNEQSIDEALSWVAHWAAEAETRSLEKHAKALLAKERSLRNLSAEEMREQVDSHIADDDEDRRTPHLSLSPPPVFHFDGETWQAVIAGKHLRLKNPEGHIAPPPAGLHHAEEAHRFADLARGIDDILAQEARRLEDAMVGGREWLGAAFRITATHPVLGGLLSGLVCLAKVEKNEIWFRPVAGKFVDANHNPIEIPLSAIITIPHRLEIPNHIHISWKNHFTRHNIPQPFPQLDREVYTNPESLDPRDKSMKRATLAAKLREHGLRHGRPEDAGLFYYSYKRFRGRHITATFHHGAISIRSSQDFSIDPITITSISFTNAEGHPIEKENIHPVIQSETAKLLEEILR